MRSMIMKCYIKPVWKEEGGAEDGQIRGKHHTSGPLGSRWSGCSKLGLGATVGTKSTHAESQ